MQKEKKQGPSKEIIEQAIKEIRSTFEQEGRIFLGMCHPSFYGPIRGINAVLTEGDPVEVMEFLNSDRHQKMNTKFWKRTGMAATVMILGSELIQECETPPKTFRDLSSLLKYIEQKVDTSVDLSLDPFYYRKGII